MRGSSLCSPQAEYRLLQSLRFPLAVLAEPPSFSLPAPDARLLKVHQQFDNPRRQTMFTSAKNFFEPFTMGFSFKGKRASDAIHELVVSLYLVVNSAIILALPVWAFIVLN
jgi:hypothetical protein